VECTFIQEGKGRLASARRNEREEDSPRLRADKEEGEELDTTRDDDLADERGEDFL
jgi:hypothetical protein